jgi:hypothetical protein
MGSEVSSEHGDFLAFIITILGIIFREWIKNGFAQVAYK